MNYLTSYPMPKQQVPSIYCTYLVVSKPNITAESGNFGSYWPTW